MSGDDDDLIPFDATCPSCHVHSDVGEIFDGGEHHCGNCGALLNAVAFGASPEHPNGHMIMVAQREPAQQLTGRQRTRKRWARTGRR